MQPREYWNRMEVKSSICGKVNLPQFSDPHYPSVFWLRLDCDTESVFVSSTAHLSACYCNPRFPWGLLWQGLSWGGGTTHTPGTVCGKTIGTCASHRDDIKTDWTGWIGKALRLAHPSLSRTSLMLALVMMASSHLNHWSLCCRMKVV